MCMFLMIFCTTWKVNFSVIFPEIMAGSEHVQYLSLSRPFEDLKKIALNNSNDSCKSEKKRNAMIYSSVLSGAIYSRRESNLMNWGSFTQCLSSSMRLRKRFWKVVEEEACRSCRCYMLQQYFLYVKILFEIMLFCVKTPMYNNFINIWMRTMDDS